MSGHQSWAWRHVVRQQLPKSGPRGWVLPTSVSQVGSTEAGVWLCRPGPPPAELSGGPSGQADRPLSQDGWACWSAVCVPWAGVLPGTVSPIVTGLWDPGAQHPDLSPQHAVIWRVSWGVATKPGGDMRTGAPGRGRLSSRAWLSRGPLAGTSPVGAESLSQHA